MYSKGSVTSDLLIINSLQADKLGIEAYCYEPAHPLNAGKVTYFLWAVQFKLNCSFPHKAAN